MWVSTAPSKRLAAAVFALSLVAGIPADALTQTHARKRKSKKHPAASCREGCKPADTSAPQLAANTPEDEALQKELADLARNLHAAAPGAYEKLAAFANRNAANVWGGRAALALGYDDYSRNRAQQAVAWLKKAESDTLLREYALYWSAQAKRALKHTADAYVDLQTMQREYPNTAMKATRLLQSR